MKGSINFGAIYSSDFSFYILDPMFRKKITAHSKFRVDQEIFIFPTAGKRMSQ